ncbi:sensor histidine kinase [Oenococcus oeni]|nr:HAMP domain-containing sensor histidine kinase [Oenococcus oeni]
MPTKLSYFDLSRQLADCALQLEPNWEKKEIDFQADLLDHCPILADEDMLAIVWNNLLNNAIKFTPEKGKVSLIQKKQDQGVLISVVDSGIGMESSVIDHVFEQFYQGETSHSNSGNGLGLAMAKKIISLSNGTISVQSKVNLGTTFSVWLPTDQKNDPD